MMATGSQNQYSSLLYAYTLGCLENNDFIELHDYLKNNGDFNWQELGEFQNLTALLPSFLEVEEPNPQVKDKVARKLYRLKGTSRPERTTKISPPPTKEKEEEKFKNFEQIKGMTLSDADDIISEKFSERTEPKEQRFSKTQTNRSPEIKRPKHDTQIKGRSSQELTERDSISFSREDIPSRESLLKDKFKSDDELNLEEPEETTSKNEDELTMDDLLRPPKGLEGRFKRFGESKDEGAKALELDKIVDKPAPPKITNKNEKQIIKNEAVKSGVSFGSIFLLFLILAAGIYAAFYLLSNEIKEQAKISEKKVSDELQILNNAIFDNKGFSEILTSPNLLFTNLSSTQGNENIFGKVFINPVSKNGIIYLSNLPTLPNHKIYQIWITANQSVSSLGIFSFTSNSKMFPISDIPDFSRSKEVSIFLTEESSQGAERPSSTVLLKGILRISQ